MGARTSEPEVHVEHPELFHYTDFNGLSGILESQQLWATHYEHLNDTTEVNHMKEYLVEILAEIFGRAVGEIRKNSLALDLRIRRFGGLLSVVRHEARSFVESMYQVGFTGRPDAAPLSPPFICSFCSHASDNPYEKEHGLLSQWRSYGGQDGYALVFDSAELSKLLQRESDERSYAPLYIGDVIYNEGLHRFRAKFEGLALNMKEVMWQHHVVGQKAEFPDDLIKDFLISATTFKHVGFKEEREVRIVACPTPYRLREATRAMDSNDNSNKKPLVQIHGRGALSNIRYIKLFEFQDPRRLPIRRIIVGPHREQEALKRRVLQLVGNRIPVFCSQTPYVGRLTSSIRAQITREVRRPPSS